MYTPIFFNNSIPGFLVVPEPHAFIHHSPALHLCILGMRTVICILHRIDDTRGVNRAAFFRLPGVPCPLDLRRPLLPQPDPVVSVCCVCIWGLHRSCSLRPPVKACLIGSLQWKWYPHVQQVVSILFSQPTYLSSVLAHDEGHLIIEDHRVTCLQIFFTEPKGIVTREAFISLMCRSNRRYPKSGFGSPVAD